MNGKYVSTVLYDTKPVKSTGVDFFSGVRIILYIVQYARLSYRNCNPARAVDFGLDPEAVRPPRPIADVDPLIIDADHGGPVEPARRWGCQPLREALLQLDRRLSVCAPPRSRGQPLSLRCPETCSERGSKACRTAGCEG
jgi:hypothetical protein